MNIQEIKEKLSELTEGSKVIKLPFSMVEDAIKVTKDKSDLDLGVINYPNIQFFKVLAGVEILLNHLDLEYDVPMTEEGLIDSYQMYEEFFDIYDSEIYKTFYMFEELLQKEIELAERVYVQTGMFESKIIDIATKLTESIGKISEVATDKKKLGGLIKEIKKQMPELGNLLKDIKVEK